MLRATAIRLVELLLPTIELARAAVLVLRLVGEVIRDAREREHREDVLAELAPREHRRDRIVVMARATQRLAVAIAGRELQRRRLGDREGRGANDAESVDHASIVTTAGAADYVLLRA